MACATVTIVVYSFVFPLFIVKIIIVIKISPNEIPVNIFPFINAKIGKDIENVKVRITSFLVIFCFLLAIE